MFVGISKLLKKKGTTKEVKDSTSYYSRIRGIDGGRYDDDNSADMQKQISYFLRNSIVYNAVNTISQEVLSIKTALYDKQKDELVYDHPFLSLVNNPNPFTDSLLFKKTLTSSFLLTGNSYLVITGDKEPLELYNIQPQEVTPMQDTADGFAGKYLVTQGNSLNDSYIRDINNRFIFNNGERELIHMRDYNPFYNNNNLVGSSPLTACSLEIAQYLLANIHNKSILQNQGRPSGFLKLKNDNNSLSIINDETKESIVDTLRSEFSGANNAGKIPFLTGDIDWVQLSQNVKDMDFATLKQQTAEAIYNVYRIPLPLVQSGRATMNNMQESKQMLYDQAVLPLLKMINSFLQEKVLSRYPDAERYEVTFDEETVSVLREKQTQNAKELTTIGVLTDNEIRTMLGYESIEGGDVIRKPMNLIPVGSDQYTRDNRQKPSQDDKKELYNLLKKQINKDGSNVYSDEEIKTFINNANN